jgi:hypothetical protein
MIKMSIAFFNDTKIELDDISINVAVIVHQKHLNTANIHYAANNM